MKFLSFFGLTKYKYFTNLLSWSAVVQLGRHNNSFQEAIDKCLRMNITNCIIRYLFWIALLFLKQPAHLFNLQICQISVVTRLLILLSP